MSIVSPLPEKSALEKEIDRLFAELSEKNSESDEYAKVVDQLTKLYKLKEIDSPQRVSWDTLALIAGNLAGILLIIGYERTHIVTSKAIGFVLRLPR